MIAHGLSSAQTSKRAASAEAPCVGLGSPRSEAPSPDCSPSMGSGHSPLHTADRPIVGAAHAAVQSLSGAGQGSGQGRGLGTPSLREPAFASR
jgi:hypothetical protein